MVSIIVPCWNKIEYTSQLLESIEAYTPEEHEIILIDNGSTDDTNKVLKEYVSTHPHAILIENKVNLGFPVACNQGMAAARGKYFCIINSDVLVTPEWLKGMLDCIEHREKVGIVGPMTNNVSGPQQFTGGKYKNQFQMIEFARQFRASYPGNYVPFYRIVFFCTLISRELYEEIGGLDERFSPGNFEDDDYCLRALLAGWRTYFTHDVFVHHYGSVSHNRDSYQKLLTINQAKFDAKWNKWIKEHSTVSCCTIFKNEEKRMGWFLDNILPLVDEVVLVDTGSTDRSVEIIKEKMRHWPGRIKLYDFEWVDDFSKARNFSMEKATKDWLLIMDVDECIPQFTRDILKPCSAYLVETRNYCPTSLFTNWQANKGDYPDQEQGCGWFPSTKARILPNDRRIHFDLPVHEVCERSVYLLGYRMFKAEFPVHHYGKMDLDHDATKGKAYMKYLEKLIEEDSNDLRSIQEIATQLQNLHRFEEAIPYWEKYDRLLPEDDRLHRFDAWLNLGHNHACLQRYEKALECSLKAREFMPESREAACNVAVCYFRLGKYREAADIAKAVTEKHPDYPTGLAVLAAATTKLNEEVRDNVNESVC